MKHDATIYLNLAQRVLSHLCSDEENKTDDQLPKILYVTSVNTGEGKSFIAQSIAYFIAQLIPSGVLLVDGNFERPKLQHYYKLNNRGLSELLTEECWGDHELYQPSNKENLKILTAGEVHKQGLLFMPGVLTKLRENVPSDFSFIIVDGARMAFGGKNMIQSADSTILVVDSSSTRREVIQGELSNYAIPTEKILGVVLNKKTYYIPSFMYKRL
jgi:Mrp family chromosome partitioning ATPase